MTIPFPLTSLALLVFSSTLLASTLGTIHIQDPQHGQRPIVYSAINDYAIVEGDIIIGKISELTTKNAIIKRKIGGGLWHEQSRADRDNYVTILWENISDGHRYNFNQHLSDANDIGEYDYQSIMHYSAYAFSKNGEKTIEPHIAGIEIGQRNHLSEKDIAAIATLYPKS